MTILNNMITIAVVESLQREIAELREENENLRRANLDCVDHFNQMYEELSEIKKDKAPGEIKKCCVCGTSENLVYEGWFTGYRCTSPDCMVL